MECNMKRKLAKEYKQLIRIVAVFDKDAAKWMKSDECRDMLDLIQDNTDLYGSDDIMSAFGWDETPQGIDFWSSMYTKTESVKTLIETL